MLRGIDEVHPAYYGVHRRVETLSLTSRLGLEGEAGTRDFINLWFPLADQGIGAKIVTSQGSNDIGDIDGVPYTCIECKNHSNPALSGLLNNAKWKSQNAGRPMWFLVYKKRGYSRDRAGKWNTCTTIEGLLSGFKPFAIDSEGEQVPAFSLDNVEDLCNTWTDIECMIGAEYPGYKQPELKWTIKLMFRPYKSGVPAKRDEDLYSVDMNVNDRVIPVVVHPRTGYDVEDWYVSSRLAAQVRMLETVGVVPQDPEDYEPEIDEEVLEAAPLALKSVSAVEQGLASTS